MIFYLKKKQLSVLVIGIIVITFFFIAKDLVKAIGKRYSIVEDILSEFSPNISQSIDDIQIILWADKSMSYTFINAGDKPLLTHVKFNPKKEIKVFLHGFSDNGFTHWILKFKNEYMMQGNYTIISINWDKLATSPWYTTAVKNAKLAGKKGAEFINYLVSEGASYDQVHVLGASLGAHAAGYVGHYTQGRIKRITGLDPSGPLFHTVSRADRLDKSDAQFVDVIHSAGKWVGNDDTIGHVDFYPNGGIAPQPGCENEETVDLSCSHFKSWIFFGESIEPKNGEFYALKCKNENEFKSGVCCLNHNSAIDVNIMGERTNLNADGKYYLVTNSRSYHAKNKNQSLNCFLT